MAWFDRKFYWRHHKIAKAILDYTDYSPGGKLLKAIFPTDADYEKYIQQLRKEQSKNQKEQNITNK
jgi:hypothetical protein